MDENKQTREKRGEQLDEIIAEYISAVDRDGTQDRNKWLARYPDFASELESYLDDHAQVMKWIDPTVNPPLDDLPATESHHGKVARASHHFQEPQVQPGDVLGGKFRVLQVKYGGMGCVCFVTGIGNRDDEPKAVMKTIMPYHRWRARHRDDAEPMLAARYTGLLFRFRREAMNWVRLEEHVNIIRAQSVFEVVGRPYLLLEYADSGDLSEWIKAARLTLPLAVDFALQFCRGMAHATKVAELVHRDIKPSNVLVHQKQQIKITDLGLAKASGEDDMYGSDSMGTPVQDDLSRGGGGTRPYMAPEQFVSLRDADTRSDIFSFGAMLFELLTAKRLFGKVDAFKASAGNRNLRAAHEVNPDVPPSLSAVVARCVAYDREARYRSFNEVAKDILQTGLSKRWKMTRVRREAPSRPPKQRREWNREVGSLLSLGQYEAAERLLRQAIQAEPNYHGHWLDRGKALAELERFEEAHQCYARASELAPEDVQCWFNLAYVLVSLSRAEEGLDAAERAIAINANCSEAWDAAACCQEDLHGPRAALHYFRRAIDIGQTVGVGGYNWRALTNLGRCLSLLGQQDEALSFLEKAVAVNPDAEQAWFQIACIQGENKQYEKALQAVDRCLRVNERNAASWSMRGVLLTQIDSSAGGLRQAADCFRRAIALDPNDSLSSTLLGQVEAQLDTK